jgi:hypothetical protein
VSPNPRQGGTAPISAAVGRRDAHLPWAGAPDHRTDLVVLSLVDGAPRDRRAVLSPWGGTAPNPAPAACWAVCRRPPCRPLVWTRWPARAPSGVRPETAVSPLPVWTTRPTCAPSGVRPETAVPSYPRGAARLPPAALPAPAKPPRDRRVALPRGTAPDRPRRPRVERPLDRRVVLTPVGGAAPGSPRPRRWAAWLGPPCRPRRGEEGDTA